MNMSLSDNQIDFFNKQLDDLVKQGEDYKAVLDKIQQNVRSDIATVHVDLMNLGNKIGNLHAYFKKERDDFQKEYRRSVDNLSRNFQMRHAQLAKEAVDSLETPASGFGDDPKADPTLVLHDNLEKLHHDFESEHSKFKKLDDRFDAVGNNFDSLHLQLMTLLAKY